MFNKLIAWVSAAGLWMVAASAHAHHSFAMFSMDKCQRVEGTVVDFKLSYPHAWLWVMTHQRDGQEETWAFEGGEPASLRLAGWTNKTLAKGQKVTVIFNPARDERQGGFLKRVRLPDGRVLGGAPAQLPNEPRDCDFSDVNTGTGK